MESIEDQLWQSKNLFEVLLESVVRKTYTLEDVVDMAYEFGVEHGKRLNEKQVQSKSKGNPSVRVLSSPHPSRSTTSSGNGQKRPAEEKAEPDPATPASLSSLHSIGMKSYIGVQYVPDQARGRHALLTAPFHCSLTMTLYNRTLQLGAFLNAEEAAAAHDRALIRALGPRNCKDNELNRPLAHYAQDPLEVFEQYDTLLKKGLFGTSWSGPKDCDFSFLVLQAAVKRPKHV